MSPEIVDRKVRALASCYNSNLNDGLRKLSLPEIKSAFIAQTNLRAVELGLELYRLTVEIHGGEDNVPPTLRHTDRESKPVGEIGHEWAVEPGPKLRSLFEPVLGADGVDEPPYKRIARGLQAFSRMLEMRFGFDVDDPNTPPAIRQQMINASLNESDQWLRDHGYCPRS